MNTAMKPRSVLLLILAAAACAIWAALQLWSGVPETPGGGSDVKVERPDHLDSRVKAPRVGVSEPVVASSAGAEVLVAGRVAAELPADDPLVRVRTVSDEGDVLVGCQIVLRSAISPRGEMPYKLPMQEEADGLHVARGLPQGDYDVIAVVPNRKAPLSRLSWIREKDVELTLSVSSRLDLVGGVVCDSRNVGIPDVVVLDVDQASQAFFCVTDQQGRFLFCKRPESAERGARFSLSSRRGAPVADSSQPTELFWGQMNCRIPADERAEVTVRLADRSGKTIEDFTVHTETLLDGDCSQRTARAAEGVARVRAVPTGRARVLAIPSSQWRPVWGAVDVGADGRGSISLVTDAAVELLGTVTSGGRLLGGADVVARLDAVIASPADDSSSTGFPVRRGASDSRPIGVSSVVADGSFRFGCDPTLTYRLHVTAPRHSPWYSTITGRDGSFDPVVVELVPESTVRAIVSPRDASSWLEAYAQQHGPGAAEKNCCFALVQANQVPGTKREERLARPRVDGVLEFASVPVGRWRLWFRGPLKPLFLGEVEVGAGQPTAVDRIDLEDFRPGYLRGRVDVGEALGKPILLSVSNGDGQVQIPIGTGGRFDIALPGGDYYVRVRLERPSGVADVTLANRVRVTAGSVTPMEGRLAVLAMRIRLVDNASGRPLPDLRLCVDEDRAFGEFKVWTTGPDGEATIEPCPLGEFGVSVLGSDEEWKHLQRLACNGVEPVVVRIQH